MINYRSIQDTIVHELEIKKSRFISYLIPIQNEEEFQVNLDQIKKEHPKATHHCYAYILEETGQIQRMSDDGEPSGTAGIPILEVLKQENLTYLMAVVVRYFGGIKLGAGGLIRAYSSATSQALQISTLVENTNQAIINLNMAYKLNDSFQYFISQLANPPQILDSQYLDTVIHQIAISQEEADLLEQQLADRFNQQIDWQFDHIRPVNLPIKNSSKKP